MLMGIDIKAIKHPWDLYSDSISYYRSSSSILKYLCVQSQSHRRVASRPARLMKVSSNHFSESGLHFSCKVCLPFFSYWKYLHVIYGANMTQKSNAAISLLNLLRAILLRPPTHLWSFLLTVDLPYLRNTLRPQPQPLPLPLPLLCYPFGILRTIQQLGRRVEIARCTWIGFYRFEFQKVHVRRSDVRGRRTRDIFFYNFWLNWIYKSGRRQSFRICTVVTPFTPSPRVWFQE